MRGSFLCVIFRILKAAIESEDLVKIEDTKEDNEEADEFCVMESFIVAILVVYEEEYPHIDDLKLHDDWSVWTWGILYHMRSEAVEECCYENIAYAEPDHIAVYTQLLEQQR